VTISNVIQTQTSTGCKIVAFGTLTSQKVLKICGNHPAKHGMSELHSWKEKQDSKLQQLGLTNKKKKTI
jgi:hypothetical protein